MCYVPCARIGGLEMANKTKKSRYWGFVAYPSSVPSDWLEVLQMTGLPIAISPIHDKDTNADGTIKLAHWHVLLCFDGPTTLNCVQDISGSVHGTLVIPINSCKGMYRYHVHLDNPEKYPYWKYEKEYPRTILNGFDIQDYSSLTSSEESQMNSMVFDYIKNNEIFEYSDLIYSLQKDDVQMFDWVCHHTLLFNAHLTSIRNKKKRNKEI